MPKVRYKQNIWALSFLQINTTSNVLDITLLKEGYSCYCKRCYLFLWVILNIDDWNVCPAIIFRTFQSLFVKIEFLTYTIIFLYFVKKNVTLVWLINLHAYVHSLRFGFFWTFLLSSNVAKTYLSIPWEIDSVVGCTLEIIHLLPVCKGKAKMLTMKPSFLILSIRLNIRTIYLKLVLNTHI